MVTYNYLGKMEQFAAINRRWSISILWSFVGCLILLVILNHQARQKPSFLALSSEPHLPTTVSVILQPSKPKPEPSNFNNITKPKPLFVAPLSEHHPPTTTTTSTIVQPPKPISKPSNTTTTTTTSTTTQDNPAKGGVRGGPNYEPTNNIPIINHTTIGENHVTSNLPKEPPSETTTTKKKCNIFDGRWVYHPEQKPSYAASQCQSTALSFRCQENHRPDTGYLKWRWEAKHCDIPLFNGTDMLERLRNKRMIFVGDSLNKNMWQSLSCLLYTSLPDHSTAEFGGKYFKAKDYNFTLAFEWSAFLVELDLKHKSGRKVLALDRISSTSNDWRGADIMVFNSWHWWTHEDNVKAWNVYEYKGQLIEKMSRDVAHDIAMKTWAKWVEKNVDPKKTTVFFRSNSETHYSSFNCVNTTQPINAKKIASFKSRIPKAWIQSTEKVIKRMSKLPVHYLNITRLTQYRSDAHPSVYTTLAKKDGSKTHDCGHWCLPGLPDTWNTLLYASLFYFDAPGDHMSSS